MADSVDTRVLWIEPAVGIQEYGTKEEYPQTGSMTIHHANTGYETNSEMDMSGARFVPIVDSTLDDDNTHHHMSDIPLQRPCKCLFWQFCIGDVLKAGGDPRQNVHSLQPIPNQTCVNTWLIAVSRNILSKGTFSSWTS